MSDFYFPAEWAKHECVWLAWPSHEDLWAEDLAPTQEEFVALCEAIADIDPTSGIPRGERLKILVPNVKAGAQAEIRLRHLPVEFHLIPFGDIWLRDTAPLFLKSKTGDLAAARFQFNGWGGKYILPHDSEVAREISSAAKMSAIEHAWVLEGGSIEVDGEGTLLTSRQCLLNPNRNPNMKQESIERAICDALGVTRILWLDQGLLNDHTDGHIDTMARFTAPGKVICMEAKAADPNAQVLSRIASDLADMVDAQGRRLEVLRIPSPGAILNEDGEIMAASYLNFYIANSTVVVPTYDSPFDDEAVRLIGTAFPNRRTVGISAKSILTGGGAFHCISQQQPL